MTSIVFDESTPSTPSSTPNIQHVDSSDQDSTKDIFDEQLQCGMMNGLMEELQGYYANPFLPPTTLVQVDIFQNDDSILEKLGTRSEFPKSSKKRLAAWFI